jgi:hypothetical protein
MSSSSSPSKRRFESSNEWKALQSRIAMLASTPMETDADEDSLLNRSRLEIAARQAISGQGDRPCPHCHRLQQELDQVLQEDEFKTRRFVAELFRRDMLLEEVERVEVVLSDCLRNATVLPDVLQVARNYKCLLARLDTLKLQIEEKPTGFAFAREAKREKEVGFLERSLQESRARVEQLEDSLRQRNF